MTRLSDSDPELLSPKRLLHGDNSQFGPLPKITPHICRMYQTIQGHLSIAISGIVADRIPDSPE